MRQASRRTAGSLGAALLAMACGVAGQTGPRATGGVVLLVTAAPVYRSLAALRGGERFPQGATLRVLRGSRMEPLAPGMAASADPSVSFDGQTVLFAAKPAPSDRWQIWQMRLNGGAPQRVTAAATDLIRPMWMPDGRMVYARREAGGFALETAAMDGSDVRRLTFLPGNFVPDDVLRDGRVLFESGFPLGSGTTPEMFLVYADGSGVESVRCDHGAAREHGRQLQDGDIVFTHGPRLARFTSALKDEAPIAAPPGEYAGDVTELRDGRWVLAVRRLGAKHFELAEWQPGARAMTTLVANGAADLVEPVVVAPRPAPNRHPSALHPWTTGNLLALDSRLSRSGELNIHPAMVRVEGLSDAGRVVVLGTAPVAEDGSCFVKAPGDRALRFVLLDARGRVLRQERGWFWVRRGEQRICVGCHTGPERAPDNRVPQILLRSTTPADVTGAEVH